MHFRNRYKNKKTPAKLYAVCGVERVAGATTFALALTNYLSSKWGYRLAYVELNGTNQMKTYAPNSSLVPFRLSGFDVFSDFNLLELSKILSANKYDCIVIDFGVLSSCMLPEFWRCQKQYVIGSLRTFREEKYEKWICLYQPTQTEQSDKLIYLGNLSTQKEIRKWQSHFHRKIHAVPLIDQPFLLPASLCTFFEEII